MERRQEITWNFRTRKDVTSGYKKIAFNVQYTNSAGEQVNTTLNTYVKAVGAPGVRHGRHHIHAPSDRHRILRYRSGTGAGGR